MKEWSSAFAVRNVMKKQIRWLQKIVFPVDLGDFGASFVMIIRKTADRHQAA